MSEWLHPQMDILGPGLTLIDVGASIGFFTIYAAKRGAKVYAFEPSTEVFDLLKRNVEVNGVSENVTLYPTLLAYHGDSYTDIANLLDELHYITPIYAGGVDYVSVPKEAA